VSLPDRPGLGLAGLFLAGLFVVVGLVFAIGSWGAYLNDTRIARSGARATGTITGKTVSRGDDDTDYEIRYEFALPDGRRQAGRHAIARDDWDTRRVGAPLAVSYDAGTPARNFPVGYGVTSLGVTIALSLLGALFAGFGGALLFAAIKAPSVPEARPPPR
jgi:Protein of unknown function (DUF3592)